MENRYSYYLNEDKQQLEIYKDIHLLACVISEVYTKEEAEFLFEEFLFEKCQIEKE